MPFREFAKGWQLLGEERSGYESPVKGILLRPQEARFYSRGSLVLDCLCRMVGLQPFFLGTGKSVH